MKIITRGQMPYTEDYIRKVIIPEGLALAKGFTPSDKRINDQVVFVNTTSGCILVSFLIVGKKSKGNLRRGYQLAYVYNFTYPSLSEGGDIYVDKDSQGNFFRA